MCPDYKQTLRGAGERHIQVGGRGEPCGRLLLDESWFHNHNRIVFKAFYRLCAAHHDLLVEPDATACERAVRHSFVHGGLYGIAQFVGDDDGHAACTVAHKVRPGQIKGLLGDLGIQRRTVRHAHALHRIGHRTDRLDGGDVEPFALSETRGEVGDLTRVAIVDRQLVEAPVPRTEQRVHRRAPVPCAAERRGLRHVAHDRERARRAAADEHAPVHGGQFLRLIDDDVPIGPFAVRGGALRDQLRRVTAHVVGEHLR